MNLRDKVIKNLQKHRMIANNEHILIACSGGVDSMTLLDVMVYAKGIFHLKLSVAHVNHMLRPGEAEEDEVFVEKRCHYMGLPFYSLKIDVKKYAIEQGKSIEDAARIIRYQYFQKIATQIQANKIAIGHHQDDQAETVLYNIIRGAGGRGIRGMRPVNGNIIRPLLGLTRQEIDNYCVNRAIGFRLDSSNNKDDYVRNRIRHKLIPYMEKFNTAVKKSLTRTAEIIGDEYDYVQQQAASVWPNICQEVNDNIVLNTQKLSGIHLALQREVIRQAIMRKIGHARGITFYHVEKLIEHNRKGQVGTIIELPGQIVVEKGYNTIIFRARKVEQPKIVQQSKELIVPGITEFPDLGIKIFTQIRQKTEKASVAGKTFDWEEIMLPLYVRTRLSGDRFQPSGMNQSKKLKDYFIDNKILRTERDFIPLICDGKGIIAVGSYRQSERAKVNINTNIILDVLIQKQEEQNNG